MENMLLGCSDISLMHTFITCKEAQREFFNLPSCCSEGTGMQAHTLFASSFRHPQTIPTEQIGILLPRTCYEKKLQPI